MLIYILATIMSAIFIGIAHHFYIFNKDEYILKNNKFIQKKKINLLCILFIVLSILPLALVSSLRVGLGTDYYYTYYPGFYQILGGNNPYGRELIPFFYYLNKLIQLFSDNPQWIFVITSFIFVTSFVISIVKMSDNWICSVIIFVFGGYYLSSMNNVRQWVSVSLITMSYSYLVDKKFARGIIMVIFALCFHTSTILIIPLLVLVSIPKLKKYLIYISIICLILTPFYLTIIELSKDKINYEGYFELMKNQPLMIYIMPYLTIYIVLLIYHNQLDQINKYSSGLIVIFTFGVTFSLLSSQMVGESTIRLTNWFLWPLIYLIPSFTKINKNKIVANGLATILTLIVIGVAVDRIVLNGWYEVIPYRDIWNHIFY